MVQSQQDKRDIFLMIDGKNLFNQSAKNGVRAHKNIIIITAGNEYKMIRYEIAQHIVKL